MDISYIEKSKENLLPQDSYLDQVLISKADTILYVTWFSLACEPGSVFGASQTLMYIGMPWNPVKTELLIGGSGVGLGVCKLNRLRMTLRLLVPGPQRSGKESWQMEAGSLSLFLPTIKSPVSIYSYHKAMNYCAIFSWDLQEICSVTPTSGGSELASSKAKFLFIVHSYLCCLLNCKQSELNTKQKT